MAVNLEDEPIASGSFGQIYELDDNRIVKFISLIQEDDFGFVDGDRFLSSALLREISALNSIDHPNVIKPLNISFEQEGQKSSDNEGVFITLPRGKGDLTSLSDTTRNNTSLMKEICYQCALGILATQDQDILHRDLKPQNYVYFSLNPVDVRLIDFGSALLGYCSEPNNDVKPENVTTLYYRAPELLFEMHYSDKSDTWSLACIFYELVYNKALFPGDSEIDMLFKMFHCLGSIDIINYPEIIDSPSWNRSFENPNLLRKGYELSSIVTDPLLLDLLRHMLVYDPKQRYTVQKVILHPWFDDIRPQLELLPISCGTKLKNRAVNFIIDNSSYLNVRSQIILQIIDWCNLHKLRLISQHKSIVLADLCHLLISKYDSNKYALACLTLIVEMYETSYFDGIDNQDYDGIRSLQIEILKLMNYNLNFTVTYDYINRLYRQFYSPKCISLALESYTKLEPLPVILEINSEDLALLLVNYHAELLHESIKYPLDISKYQNIIAYL